MEASVPLPHGCGEARPDFPDILSMFRYAVAACPDTTALINLGRRLTYRQESRAVAALAARLRSEGATGRVVALLVPNSMEYHLGYFAILMAGGIPALFNPSFPAEALKPLLQAAAPALVLTLPAIRPTVEQHAATFGYRCLSFGPDLDIEALVAEGVEDDGVAPDPNAPAALLFSGGTTGISKSVLHSHQAMMVAVRRIEWGWPTRARGEVWLPIAPFFHVYGFLFGVTAPVFACATTVIPERFQPDLIVSMLSDHKVTVFGGGPAPIYAGLLAATNFAQSDLSHLRVCPGGGAPFSAELIRRWKAATGQDIYEGYGMTEIAPIAVNTRTFGVRVGSVGKPVPDTLVQAVDLQTGTLVLPPGQQGELRVRGPHQFTGYGNRPDENVTALRDGFVYTGDIGYVDDEGFVFITDRRKDVIFVKGFNVFPREVEEALFTHEGVAAVGVVGAADDRAGEKTVAFVTANPGSAPSEAELKAFCSARLAPYKVPAEIHILPALPLTPAGKLDRLRLREIARSA